jgi:hypothetical protein
MIVRLSDDDRDWVRDQARLFEKVTGKCSESEVIQLAIRRVREEIAKGTITWEVDTD